MIYDRFTDKKAIALRYIQSDNAPKVTAKGANEIAEKIIELAKENNIPIQEDKDLVEVLYTLDIGYEIPEELYTVVAELLAFVYLANKNYKNYLEEIE